jgi:hypothetical protein
MAGKPKPRSTRISSLTQLQAGVPQEMLPIDQLVQYYGGRAGVMDAVRQSDALQRQVYPSMADIDPEMVDMFPPVSGEGYFQPTTMLPINEIDPGAPLATPVGYMDSRMNPDGLGNPEVMGMLPDNFQSGNVVNLNKGAREWQLLDPNASSDEVISGMVEQPMTTNITDPMGVDANSLRGTPLISRDEASDLAQMLMDSDGYAAGEMGGNDFEAVAQGIQDRSRPFAIDQALAQLRRTQAPMGGPSGGFTDTLLDANIDGTLGLLRGSYPGDVVNKSGLNIVDLIAMAALPKRVRNFLPTRMGMIPSVLGATTAAGAAGYGMSKDPNMIGRSTMGGASY